MQPERVIIARVSAVVATTIVVTVIVAATVGAFGSLLFGLLIPNIKIVIISSAAAHELRLRSSE
jgi:hypothetical protein